MDTYVHARSARPTGACAHSSFNFRSIFHQKLACHLILLLLIDKIKRDLQLCTGQTELFALGGEREREYTYAIILMYLALMLMNVN